MRFRGGKRIRQTGEYRKERECLGGLVDRLALSNPTRELVIQTSQTRIEICFAGGTSISRYEWPNGRADFHITIERFVNIVFTSGVTIVRFIVGG